MARRTTGRAYKELTLQQLRSFCETARLGIFAAAAGTLGLTNPTVWAQVHALERQFGIRLVMPYGRGCKLTAAGRVLADLAGPMVTSIASLKRRLQEDLGQIQPSVTVATTPCILVEDLPRCVIEFERRHPEVRLAFRECRHEDVCAEVESGAADFGLVHERPFGPGLAAEPCYLLDILLVTPKDHPLARRRVVRPRDLCAYPLVNSPNAISDSALTAALEKLGAFRTERRVEAYFNATIRRYVALGFGIGLVAGLLSARPKSPLHERSMSRWFGRAEIPLLWRKGNLVSDAARAFADTVKRVMASGR
jgi:DNA-binding transcriptional LysR family regulator